MKTFILTLTALGSALAATAAPLLVSEGKSDYVIVVSPQATPSERTASIELQEFIKALSGAELPLVKEEEYPGKAILVGQTPRIARELGVDFATLKPDEIILRRLGDNLILTGDRPSGVLYAAYEFLEGLGVRQWTRWDTDIPKRPTLELPDWNLRYAPPFFGRDRLGGVGGAFGAWMRVNGHWLNVPPSHGGIIKLIGWCHTFTQLIPRDRYFAKHPEYFALVEGERGPVRPDGGDVQLCLTNPEVIQLLTEKTLEWLRKESNPRLIALSQNDSWGPMANNYCRCDSCRAIDEKEESPAGSLLYAVNRVAEAVEREFPRVLIETLAYQYTVKPPKTIRPRENVMIRFCTRKNVLLPLSSPENQEVREQFLAWSRIASKLSIWDYTSNFANTMMPYPSWRPFAEDLRFLAANHVVSVLEQGYSAGEAGDLIPLQNYLLCKLLWNPSLDPEALTREFTEGYYGAAAPAIRDYMDAGWEVYRKNQLASRQAAKSGEFGDMVALRVLPRLPLADLLTLKAIFDRAEKLAAEDAAKLRRVRIAALAVDFPILYSEEADFTRAETPEGRALRDKLDLAALARRAGETVAGLRGKEHYREATQATLARYADSAEKRVTGDWNAGKKIPPEFTKYPAADLRVYGPADFTVWSSEVAEQDGRPVIKMDPKKAWRVHFSFDDSRVLGTEEWQVLAGFRTRYEGNSAGMNSVEAASTHFPIRRIAFTEIEGPEFRYIDLGRHRFTGKRGYIVFSPSGAKQELEMQYLILLRNGYHPLAELPEVCKGMKPEDFRLIPADRFQFWEKEVERSEGTVVLRSGKPGAVQCRLPALPGRWKLLVTLRADGPAKGPAAQLWSREKSSLKTQFSLEEIGGAAFRTVEAGEIDTAKEGLLTFSRRHPATALHLREAILVRLP